LVRCAGRRPGTGEEILWVVVRLEGGEVFSAVADYWHIDTGGKDASPDGGLLPRMHPGHTIMVYVTIPSIDKAVAKVQKLGGTVCKQKTAVPHMGYFVICEDTEHNAFANQRAA